MTAGHIDWSGTPDEIEAVAEALSRLLGAELKRSPRLLSPEVIFDAMRSLAGLRCWDAMPVADSGSLHESDQIVRDVRTDWELMLQARTASSATA